MAVHDPVRGQASGRLGRRMLARLSHRGPDDEGGVAVGPSWLGHRRLSIVDLATGGQPLCDEERRHFLVCNGEIYNFREVRAGLPGARFLTHSDNEVALHLVLGRGPDHLRMLRGMFAFVVAGVDGTFLAARDPVGIKPLYWARQGGRVVFASELKAFDEDLRPVVEVFPPGHYWTDRTGLVPFQSAVPHRLTRPVREADPASSTSAGQGSAGEIPETAVRAVREVLVRSVERQMMGDVPIGVFLSGGLDSSLVAAIAARWCHRHGRPLATFSVGLSGSLDLGAARRVAEFLGTRHHEAVYSPEDAIRCLPAAIHAIEHYDPQLVHSAVANYLLARHTAAHVKVVLTGEGADELFAGYDYHQDLRREEELHGELVRTVRQLHQLNLQRCDRTTMAHGLEGRVPYLELEMIELGLSLPPAYKISTSARPEKYLLRKAFEGWLPPEILWRKKVQFGDGSGVADVLRAHLTAAVGAGEFERERTSADPPLRSREELAYYRLWSRSFAGTRPRRVLGWSTAG